MMKNRSKRGLALLCTLAFTAAACGGSDDATPAATDAPADEPATTDAPADEPATTDAPADEPATTDAPADEPATTDAPADEPGDPLGEANPATGDDLNLFWMWSGVSPAVDNSADLASQKAITQWINEYGGGIGADHRKLVFEDCATNSDNAVAAACGGQIVESGTPAVLFNVVGEIEPWATPTIAAGIPIFNYASADASILGSPDLVFTNSNPVAGIAYAPAAIAKAIGAAKTTIVVIDVPAASGPASQLAPLVFEQAGAGEVNVLPISPTAPDHSADIQAELQVNSPDLVSIIGNPAFCSLTIRALRDAGFEGAIAGISNCIDAAALEQLGSDLEGVYISYSAGEDLNNADYQTYLSIVDKYDPTIVPHGTPVGAWVAIENFHRVMADYSGDYSAASIAEHIRNHGPLPQTTVDGATFQCNSTALPILPTACTAAFTYSQLDVEGNPTTYVAAS